MAELQTTSTSTKIQLCNQEAERIRDKYDLVRREINRQKPDVALRHLHGLNGSIEQFADTAIWAEFPLLVAEAYAVKATRHDGTAEPFFEDAIQRIKNLTEPSADLEMRAHVSFGRYCSSILGRRAKARQQFELAKGIASEHRLCERAAEIQLQIVPIDLETDDDPEAENFMTLRRVAGQGDYTCEEQLAAWLQHLGNTEQRRPTLKFARNQYVRSGAPGHRGGAGDDYFRNLLKLVRATAP